jgi:hypothetical protein
VLVADQVIAVALVALLIVLLAGFGMSSSCLMTMLMRVRATGEGGFFLAAAAEAAG